jgi:hypothetical protein
VNNTVEFEEWWKENSALVPNDEATKELVRWGFVNGQAASKSAYEDALQDAGKLTLKIKNLIPYLDGIKDVSEALTATADDIVDEMSKDTSLVAHRLRC